MDNSQKVNILMVDDRPENLLALEAVLASSGYNLIRANSGEEALRWILKEDFAVILLDVQMPGLNGFETAEIIKSREKTKHLPIIFITALSKAAEHVSQGYKVGAIDYLFKPFNPEILRQKVEAFAKIYEHNKRLEELHYERSKERVKQSEDRFFKIFNASPDLIVIRSLKDLRYLDVNKSWEVNTGFTREEAIGKTIIDLGLAGDSQTKRMVNEIGQIRKILNERITYRTKGGEIRIGLVSTDIIELNGEECVLSVIKDITDLTRVEEGMARLDRLNLIGEMAAGIGHEIRNPLTTIRGFLQLLEQRDKSKVHKGYFSLMIEEIDRANSIITEFLSLAKNNSVVMHRQNLNNIIKTIIPLINADAMRGSKQVVMELKDLPDIELNENEIRQLILNLVRNGFDAMKPNGKLTIRTFCKGDQVILAIKDEGKTIPVEVLEKLGTPFFTTKESGTGLGLAICYSIAARHNGTICVETGSAGTTFFVNFKVE